jgi:hypothetical protein
MKVVGLPTAYLIDAKGKLKLGFKGGVNWQDEDVRKIILNNMEGNFELPKNTFKSSSLNQQIVNIKKSTDKEINRDRKNNNQEEKSEQKSSKK